MLLAVDDAVGRILDALTEQGDLDNTVIVVTSDNGPEYNTMGKTSTGLTLATEKLWMAIEGWDVTYENLGQPGSMAAIGHEWASVSAAPLLTLVRLDPTPGIATSIPSKEEDHDIDPDPMTQIPSKEEDHDIDPDPWSHIPSKDHDEWARDWISAVKLDGYGRPVAVSPFLPSLRFRRPMDLELTLLLLPATTTPTTTTTRTSA